MTQPMLKQPPKELGTISKEETDCRWVLPSKCLGVYFDRITGRTFELNEMPLTRDEIAHLAALIANPAVTDVVLYRDDDSVSAAINGAEEMWNITEGERF